MKANLGRAANKVANMGKNAVVPLGINSRVAGSTAHVPIFMYNGTPYIQSGSNLRPVQPTYTTNGVTNAPLTNANWGLQGPKVPGAFNVTGLNPSTWGNWAKAPGPTTTISNQNAAAFLRNVNAGKIKVPNVPLANIGMKPVNNVPAIQISNLPAQSQKVILGTSLLDKLKPTLPTLEDFFKSRQGVLNKLFTSQVKNIPKNETAVNTFINNIQQCPAPQKFLKFLQALPATVGANNKTLLINTNINSISNSKWAEVQNKLAQSGLDSNEFMFFRDLVKNKDLVSTYNQTLAALPGSNRLNRKTREQQFVVAWTLQSIIAMGGAGAAYAYGVATSPAAIAAGGMVLRSGLVLAGV